jgi:hypothetical protein
VELAVGGSQRRVVPEQVVGRRVAHHLCEARGEIVAIDDRAGIRVVRQDAERVLRRLQHVVVGRLADGRLAQVELVGREAARIERVDGGVGAVGRVVHVAQIARQVRVHEEVHALLRGAVRRHRVVASRVAEAGHRRHRVAQLRRQDVGVALADEDHALAPLAEPPEVHDESFQRGQAHGVPNLLHRLRGVVRVLLFERVARAVVVLASLELLDGSRDGVVVAAQLHVVDRHERVHDRDQVVRPELRLEELLERRANAHAAAPPDVIVVQEDDEDAHVLACRLGLLVGGVPNLARRLVAGQLLRGGGPEVDELERIDLLRLAVLGDVEVLELQVLDRVPLLVADDGVHAHVVDAGLERGLLRRRNRLLRLLVGGRLLRLTGLRLGVGLLRAPRQHQGGDKREERHQQDGRTGGSEHDWP